MTEHGHKGHDKINERDLILYQHDDQAKPSTEIADSYMADVLFPLLQYRPFLVIIEFFRNIYFYKLKQSEKETVLLNIPISI